MPTVQEIYSALNRRAPFRLQESWDNSGFLAGDPAGEVTRILTALDITDAVIEEAHELGAQLIVSHHPVIFRPLKTVTNGTGDLAGHKLWRLGRYNIAAICLHTNLDAVEGGVNTCLAQALGLENTAVLEEGGTDDWDRPAGIGRIGTLPQPMAEGDFVTMVKEALLTNALRYCGTGKPIRKVAVGGGACGDFLYAAAEQGCDAFVTGDVKYNQYLDAAELGVLLVDAGHFPTENVAVPALCRWLTEEFPGTETLISRAHREVISAL